MATHNDEVPTAHLSDETAVAALVETLNGIHGPSYGFSVDRWSGRTVLEPATDRMSYHVVIEAEDSSVEVAPGDRLRGSPPGLSERTSNGRFSRATDARTVPLRPGDVITVAPGEDPVELTGSGTRLGILTERTAYRAARFCFLRHIPDEPAGCAEYEGAFRREVLPPEPSDDESDSRGSNRVNLHTIDMRHDREPEPVQHYHEPVTTGHGGRTNHTETAIVLDRSTYGRPPVEGSDEHVRIFRRPREDASDWFDLRVDPGSIVVTPATEDRVYGHCFRNAFAVLVAVPGFTAPLTEIGRDAERAGETHRKYHS